MATAYSDYDIQLQNDPRGTSVIAAGGKFIVLTAGTARRATLYNPDSGYASLSQPVTPTRGKIRFATLSSVEKVDIVGFTPDGCFVARKNIYPGRESEIFYNPHDPNQVAVIPFYWGDVTVASETDTGLDFTAGQVVLPNPFLKVVTADATETIDVGLLSSESGGDADGFLVAPSVGTASATVKGTVNGTDTLGALLKTDTNGSSVLVPEGHVVATAVSIVLTLSTGSDTAEGFVYLPYINPVMA